MKNNFIREEIKVKENKIGIIRFGNSEYISLTDLVRYADEDAPRYPIQNWMKNKDVISYLSLWESVNNENFKGVEFDTFKNEVGSNKFKISPQKWINETNAIGIISKSGNGGDTYAHSDIALEFASWLSIDNSTKRFIEDVYRSCNINIRTIAIRYNKKIKII